MIHITQCLCANDHCITGIAYESGVTLAPVLAGKPQIPLTEDNAPEFLERLVKLSVEHCGLDASCGLCCSALLHYIDTETKLIDLNHAKEIIIRLQLIQQQPDSIRIRAKLNGQWSSTSLREAYTVVRNQANQWIRETTNTIRKEMEEPE